MCTIPLERAPRVVASRFYRGKGFTLIEVVLALGVLGLAFVPLMGLLPVGMNVFRSSVDRSAAARVVEQLANEARQSAFEGVLSSSGADLYFDEQGTRVRGRTEAVFHAKLTVLDEKPHLKRLVIQVARSPGAPANLLATSENGLWKEGGALPVMTRSVLLARFSTE